MPGKYLLLGAALLFGGTLPSSAQQREIELDSKWVNNSDLEISAVKRPLGSYTVLLRFSQMQNTRQGPSYKTVMRGDTERLLTIKAINPEQPVNCGYTYSYIRGYHSPKLDSSFVYRLPFSTTHAPVQVATLYNLNERHFEGKPIRGWSSWQFPLNEGDTVFAMRKGMVVETHDGEAPVQKGLQSTYRSKSNSILIEHGDGTLCTYGVLENGSMMVNIGDIVYPGTPLAKAGTYYQDGEYQVRTVIYFPSENKNYRSGDPQNSSFFEWVHYNPHFATTDATVVQLRHGDKYRAATSPELLQREMTKKEIKQYTSQ